MRQCYQFLIEIEMHVLDIGNIIHLYPTLLGSCALKKATSLLTILNTGKKWLCSVIKENPEFLTNLFRGAKVEWLPIDEEELRSKMMNTKFLLDLGFAENSSEKEKALKVFRGKGVELQERFNCLVNAGLDRKHIAPVLKLYPQILNQRCIIDQGIKLYDMECQTPQTNLRTKNDASMHVVNIGQCRTREDKYKKRNRSPAKTHLINKRPSLINIFLLKIKPKPSSITCQSNL